MPKYEFNLVINIAGVECEHTAIAMYDYNKAEKGQWLDGYQIEPDYPESVDVYEIYIPTILDRPFTYLDHITSEYQYNALEDEILESLRG